MSTYTQVVLNVTLEELPLNYAEILSCFTFFCPSFYMPLPRHPFFLTRDFKKFADIGITNKKQFTFTPYMTNKAYLSTAFQTTDITELDLFLDWLKPYIEPGFLGYTYDVDRVDPKLIYKSNDKIGFVIPGIGRCFSHGLIYTCCQDCSRRPVDQIPEKNNNDVQ